MDYTRLIPAFIYFAVKPTDSNLNHRLFCLFVFVTREGFTTVAANEGLEKARAYLNQVPQDRRLYIPSEGCGVNFRWKLLQTTPTHLLGQS